MISRRFLLPALLVCLLTAGLALASTAAAQQKAGEGTSPANMSLPGEVDLLKGNARYDLATGMATYDITSREAPGTRTDPKVSAIEYAGGLVTSTRPCTEVALEEEEKAGGGYPTFAVFGFSKTETAGQPDAYSDYEIKKPTEAPNPANFGPATKSLVGTTLTLTGADSRAINGLFTCVEVLAIELDEPNVHDALFFPLTVPSEPPPVVVPTPPAPPAPTPAAAAALSLAKLKPLTLKADKWTPVRITVTNTGGAATVPGSVQLKLPPKGLKVRPVKSRQQVPALAPGRSWTVSFRVKPTEEAKQRSKISFVASAGSLLARGSLIAKLEG